MKKSRLQLTDFRLVIIVYIVLPITHAAISAYYGHPLGFFLFTGMLMALIIFILIAILHDGHEM